MLLDAPPGLGIAGVGGGEQRPGEGGDQAVLARVLEVWEHFSGGMAGGEAGTAVMQLIHDNQKLVFSALVATGQHDRVLGLLRLVSDLFPHGVGLWMQQLKEQGEEGVAGTQQQQQQQGKQQHQKQQLQQQRQGEQQQEEQHEEEQEQTAGGRPAAVSPGVLQNAVELMIETGTPPAALAAEQLVTHLLAPHDQQQQQQQQTPELEGILVGQLGPHVLRLLCQHSRLSSARALLASIVQHEHGMDRGMGKAVASLLRASASAAAMEQESTLQQLVDLWGRSEGFWMVVVDAVEQLLVGEVKDNKADIALGVHVLEQACKKTAVEQQLEGGVEEGDGWQEQQQWPALLTMAGRDKLTLLCCGSTSRSTSGSSSSSSSGSSSRCSSSSGSGNGSNQLQLLPSPEHLAWALVCSQSSLSKDAAVRLMNTLANDQPELQPATMAHLFGLLQEGTTCLGNIGAAPSRQELQTATDAAPAAPAEPGAPAAGPAAPAPAAAAGNSKGCLEEGVIATRSFLLAQLCYRQLRKAASEEDGIAAGAGAVSSSIAGSLGWVAELSKDTASAALFASWFWSRSAAADAGPAAAFLAVGISESGLPGGNAAEAGFSSAEAPGFAAAALQLPIPDAAAVGVLCLELYHTSRQGKPSLESLLLDLALLSAAAAGEWNEGK